MTLQKPLAAVLAAILVQCAAGAAAGGGPQLPDFFPGPLKDEWHDVQSSDQPFSVDTCAKRVTMLKTMSTIPNPQMGQYRAMVLEDLGLCALFVMKDTKLAVTRFGSAISEAEMITRASESDFLKVPQLQVFAPLIFNRDASKAMKDERWGDAAMSLRRVKTVHMRNMDKEIKNVAKNNNLATAEELKNNFEQVKRNLMPKLQEHPQFRVQLVKMQLGDDLLKRIDKASRYNSQRQRSISESKYLPGLLYADTHWKEGHPIYEDLKELADKFPKQLAEKSQISLVSPSKGEKGACDESVWPEFCQVMSKKKYYSDVSSNIFGGATILNSKKTQQKLEACESNAVIGLLFSAASMTLVFPENKVGLTLAPAETLEVAANDPVFVNFCRAVEVTRSAPALFIQMWHPEVAPIERTGFIRTFAKDKDLGNALAKLVNSGSDQWEKSKKEWQTGEHLGKHHNIKEEDLESDKERGSRLKDEAKAKETEEETEESRQEAVKRLEEERQKKAAHAANIAEKRREQAAKREVEKMAAKPYIDFLIKMKSKDGGEKTDTTLRKEEDSLDALRAEKRELDRQLEFGKATDIMKQINAQERRVQSAEKIAQKAFKKAGKKAQKQEEEGGEKSGSDSKAELMTKKAELEKTIKAKKEAAENDDFKKAKELKTQAAKLEAEIAALQAKDEL